MPATFESFVLSWLTTVAIVRFKGSGYREYESICRNHLVPAFADVPVEAITSYAVQRYVADKVSGGLSPRTVRNHVQVLRLVLDYALVCGLVHQNVARNAAWPRHERQEMRYLAPDQLHRLIEVTCPSWRLLIGMAALTGLRKGEQLALRFSDIDLDRMTISVSKSIRGGIVTTPKTPSSVGVIPLPPSLVPLLVERRAKAPDPDGLAFCRQDGAPLPDSLPGQVLGRALAASGLPQIRWHDLRHSWVVAHLQAGTDVPTIVRLGRWKSADVMLSTYAHVLPSGASDAVRRLEEVVNSDR